MTVHKGNRCEEKNMGRSTAVGGTVHGSSPSQLAFKKKKRSKRKRGGPVSGEGAVYYGVSPQQKKWETQGLGPQRPRLGKNYDGNYLRRGGVYGNL